MRSVLRTARDALSVGIVALSAVVSCTSKDAGVPDVSGVRFVSASSELRPQCVETARTLEFPVPCPSRLPAESHPTVFVAGNCPGRDVWIGPGCASASGDAFASVEYEDPQGIGHLVIVAAPRATPAAEIIYSPSPEAEWGSPKLVGERRVGGAEAGIFHVAEDSSTAFGGHTVVVWTVDGHTYALGFHGLDEHAAALNDAVLRDLELVSP